MRKSKLCLCNMYSRRRLSLVHSTYLGQKAVVVVVVAVAVLHKLDHFNATNYNKENSIERCTTVTIFTTNPNRKLQISSRYGLQSRMNTNEVWIFN